MAKVKIVQIATIAEGEDNFGALLVLDDQNRLWIGTLKEETCGWTQLPLPNEPEGAV